MSNYEWLNDTDKVGSIVSLEKLNKLNNKSFLEGYNRNIPFEIMDELKEIQSSGDGILKLIIIPMIYHYHKQGVKVDKHIRSSVIMKKDDRIISRSLLDLPLDLFGDKYVVLN